MSQPAPSRQPVISPRVLKLLAIAFAIGLAFFLMLWIDQRSDGDFFKASDSDASSAEEEALPAPLPADVAGDNDNASGLRIPAPAAPPMGTPDPESPRIVETYPSVPAPEPPAPAPEATPNLPEIDQPIAILRPAPRYPPEALRRNIGGIVRVQVVVSPDGSVERMELASSSGDRYLDRAAMEALRRWRFQPAIRNGQPVTASVIVPLEFNPGR